MIEILFYRRLCKECMLICEKNVRVFKVCIIRNELWVLLAHSIKWTKNDLGVPNHSLSVSLKIL